MSVILFEKTPFFHPELFRTFDTFSVETFIKARPDEKAFSMP